jgi:hypothetical protein
MPRHAIPYQQADGTVADHGDPGAAADSADHGRVVAGPVDVGQRQQGRDQGRVRRDRQLDQGAVGERDPDRVGLDALQRLLVPEVGPRMGAGGLQPFPAELAAAVGDGER